MKIFRTQRLHRCVVGVDRAIDHIGFLLLQEDHTTLDGVLNTETGDGTGARLADSVASIGRLPLRRGIPPSR